MTGAFQIRKQNDGGVQELREYETTSVFAVGDPVGSDGAGNIIAWVSGAELLGVNDSQMVAPEFYSQADLDNIATVALPILISPIKERESEVEVVPSVAITNESAMKAEIGSLCNINGSNQIVVGVLGTDCQIVDYKKYTAKDGSLTFNPIVVFTNTMFV